MQGFCTVGDSPVDDGRCHASRDQPQGDEVDDREPQAEDDGRRWEQAHDAPGTGAAGSSAAAEDSKCLFRGEMLECSVANSSETHATVHMMLLQRRLKLVTLRALARRGPCRTAVWRGDEAWSSPGRV